MRESSGHIGTGRVSPTARCLSWRRSRWSPLSVHSRPASGDASSNSSSPHPSDSGPIALGPGVKLGEYCGQRQSLRPDAAGFRAWPGGGDSRKQPRPACGQVPPTHRVQVGHGQASRWRHVRVAVGQHRAGHLDRRDGLGSASHQLDGKVDDHVDLLVGEAGGRVSHGRGKKPGGQDSIRRAGLRHAGELRAGVGHHPRCPRWVRLPGGLL